jgi:hypothetical protein
VQITVSGQSDLGLFQEAAEMAEMMLRLTDSVTPSTLARKH